MQWLKVENSSDSLREKGMNGNSLLWYIDEMMINA